jgi:Mg-chelatase subunit ChlD
MKEMSVAEQRYKAVLAVISDGVPNDGEPASCSSG